MSSRHDNGGLIAVGKGVHVVQDGVGFSVDGSHMTEREPVWTTTAREDQLYRRAWAPAKPPRNSHYCPDCKQFVQIAVWEDGKLVPQFYRNASRPSGLDDFCIYHRKQRDARYGKPERDKTRKRNKYAEAKAAKGETVRRWERKRA